MVGAELGGASLGLGRNQQKGRLLMRPLGAGRLSRQQRLFSGGISPPNKAPQPVPAQPVLPVHPFLSQTALGFLPRVLSGTFLMAVTYYLFTAQ